LQTSAGDDLSIQNGQSQKERFLNGHIDQAIYSPQRVQTPRSPYQGKQREAHPTSYQAGVPGEDCLLG
jgi:hypothetical protein